MTTGLFAYFGPETFLPVVSGAAGAAGVLLMFGRRSLQFVARCCRLLLVRK